MRYPRTLPIAAACLFVVTPVYAQTHPTAPAFSSRPGAIYTLYLDFSGFNFSGTWGGSSSPSGTPGNTPAYTIDGDATTFSATEQANIKNVWSRVAEKYSAFNINVTTVDPAVAAGQNGSDSQRQAYYESTARLMHTVIGGSGSWSGGGGVSFLSTTQNSYNPSSQNGGAGAGFHTNWVFSAQAPGSLSFVGEASSHENGHGLKLNHQSDYNGSTLLQEYSSGTGGSGAGTIAPIMGNSYSTQRGTWRRGSSHAGSSKIQQNDVLVLLSNSGIGGFVDDGIGHTLATATPLPLTGSAIDYDTAKGVIMPNSTTTPNPLGTGNYTTDFFSFSTVGGNVKINLRAGRSTITASVADPGATLDGSLFLLDDGGNVLFTSATSNLNESLDVNLAAGDYFIQVASAGGRTVASGGGAEAADYYDMGSYFLTGLIAVPEPTTLGLLALTGLGLVVGGRHYRRKRLALLDADLR